MISFLMTECSNERNKKKKTSPSGFKHLYIKSLEVICRYLKKFSSPMFKTMPNNRTLTKREQNSRKNKTLVDYVEYGGLHWLVQ